MSRRSYPVGSIAATAIMFVGLAWWQSAVTRGGQPATNVTTKSGNAPQFEYLGMQSCINCHGNKNLKPDDFVSVIDLGERPADASDQQITTAEIWTKKDKHARAYRNFFTDEACTKLTDRVQRMSDLLKLKKISEEQQCMSCHANWQKDHDQPSESFLKDGVSCESCHGPAEKWRSGHDLTTWRKKTPQQKEELGMIDVRSPVRRAEQCLSCHIGNAREGKVITHEMYAAGHPPLPSIEVESFVEQMPAHWTYLKEKKNFEFRKEYVAANFSDPKRSEDLPRARAVELSGLVALRNALQLDHDQLTAGAPGANDFARFDCGACHHELRSPSWRQSRGYGGLAPGRLSPWEWPAALVGLGFRQTAADQDSFSRDMQAHQANMTAWRKTLAAQPFGKPDPQLVAAEKKLIDALDKRIASAAGSEFNDKASITAMKALLETTGSPDFHSARQIAWATRIMAIELCAGYPNAAKYDETVDTWKQARTAAQSEIDGIFSDLKLTQRLALDLPAGQDYEIEKELPRSLEAMATYDPKWFRDQMPELKKRLSTAITKRSSSTASRPTK